MSWVATAVIGSAVVGAGASIYSGNKAADALEKSGNAELALQRDIFDQQREDLAPYRDVGYSALNAYARAMGLPEARDPSGFSVGESQPGRPGFLNTSDPVVNAYRTVFGRDPDPEGHAYWTDKLAQGDLTEADLIESFGGSAEYRDKQQRGVLPPWSASGADTENYNRPSWAVEQEFLGGSETNPEDQFGGFYESPGYQWRVEEGRKGVDRNMAARGLLNSGRRGKALVEYNQNMASNDFGDYMNRLAAAAGIGQTAVNSGNYAASNYGANAGNAIQNAGQARASGYLNVGNTISSGVNNVLAALPYLQNQSTPGGSSYYMPSSGWRRV